LPKTYSEADHALRGNRIAVKARKLHKGPLLHGSAKHRIQTLILEDQAFCVIEAPLISKQ